MEHFLEGTELSPLHVVPTHWALRAPPYLHTVCILFGVMQRMENHPHCNLGPRLQCLTLCSHSGSARHREEVLPVVWDSCLEMAAAVKVVAAAGTGLTQLETFTCDSRSEGQKQNYSVKARAHCVFSGEAPSASLV